MNVHFTNKVEKKVFKKMIFFRNLQVRKPWRRKRKGRSLSLDLISNNLNIFFFIKWIYGYPHKISNLHAINELIYLIKNFGMGF